MWSSYSIKTYVVKGKGLVTTENKVNLMAGVSGTIAEEEAVEGKEVKEGDILFTLNPVDSNL
jgi:membrane fusion protein, peptide pheromone/bacteriocin exporter